MLGVVLGDNVADLTDLVHPPEHLHDYIVHDDHVLAEGNLPLLSFPLFLDTVGDLTYVSGDLTRIFPNTSFQQDLALLRRQMATFRS